MLGTVKIDANNSTAGDSTRGNKELISIPLVALVVVIAAGVTICMTLCCCLRSRKSATKPDPQTSIEIMIPDQPSILTLTSQEFEVNSII